MKITKFVHSCLLVEMPKRTALFDPGMMSEAALDVDRLQWLDDIFITHAHGDHFSLSLVKKLVAKFPDVRITATPEVVAELKTKGLTANVTPPEGAVLFDAPHEDVTPVYPQPEEIGVHYLDLLSHPGDSHSFPDTKAILALPMTGPWGGMIRAFNLAVELKPKYVLPIHDWHWNDAARDQAYDVFEQLLAKQGITFFKLQTGQPVVIEI